MKPWVIAAGVVLAIAASVAILLPDGSAFSMGPVMLSLHGPDRRILVRFAVVGVGVVLAAGLLFFGKHHQERA